MQLTLRSQMIAGATAVIGASAIAMTPVAPAVSIPSLSTAKADVALAAIANPFSALLNTGLVLGNYFLNGAYTTPAANWPGSGTNTYPAGIGSIVNGVIPTLGVVTPGLLPNIIETPFPILTTLLTNQLGYAWIAAQSVGSAIGSLSNIIWAIPATAVQVVVDLVTNPAQIIPDIQAAIAGVISDVQSAIGSVVSGVTTIVSSIVTKAQAVIAAVLADAGNLLPAVVGYGTALVGSVTGLVTNVIAGLANPNPIEGVWNALVNGLLDATVSGSLPATVINLTAGAGIQTAAITLAPPPPSVEAQIAAQVATKFLPSVRTVGTKLVNDIATALETPVSTPAAAVRAEVAAAAAVEAAPAAEAPAGDAAPSASDARSDSAEAAPVAAAPEASAAADTGAGSSDAPAKTGKAGASKGGRG